MHLGEGLPRKATGSHPEDALEVFGKWKGGQASLGETLGCRRSRGKPSWTGATLGRGLVGNEGGGRARFLRLVSEDKHLDFVSIIKW